jgi:hypothetical protein
MGGGMGYTGMPRRDAIRKRKFAGLTCIHHKLWPILPNLLDKNALILLALCF